MHLFQKTPPKDTVDEELLEEINAMGKKAWSVPISATAEFRGTDLNTICSLLLKFCIILRQDNH